MLGANVSLIASITPTKATNKNVTWSSSDTSVATVDPKGKIVGISVGTTTISATTQDGSKIATCTVTVAVTVAATVTSVSLFDGTITVTLSSPTSGDHTAIPVISDFAITALGKLVKLTAILSATYEIVTLTVPSANDQSVVYSVSYIGGDPVVANIEASNKTSNNIKVGQHFNVLLQEYGAVSPPWCFLRWTYTTNSDAMKLIQTTVASPLPVIGTGPLVIRTFQATQTGNFNLHFSRGSETLDYVINVTQP